jgi:hypothetical protein
MEGVLLAIKPSAVSQKKMLDLLFFQKNMPGSAVLWRRPQECAALQRNMKGCTDQ